MRTKAQNGDLKCMRTLNVRSINGTDLSETDGEIGNGKRVRRSNDQNEEDYEIESGLYGYNVRKYQTKQVPWVNDCDGKNVRGFIESKKERNDETVTANRGGTGNEMTVQRGGTSVKNVTAKGYGENGLVLMGGLDPHPM